MRSEPMPGASVVDARHANSVHEILALADANVEGDFKAWMDEKFHWHPDKPGNAGQAGLKDAKKCPPIPGEASAGPLEESLYLIELHRQSRAFLEEKISACRRTFDRLKDGITDQLNNGSGFLEDKVFTEWTDQIQGAIKNYEDKQRSCYEYANREEHINIVGNRPLDPKPRSPVIFVCFLVFVVVFEFVWVWYFLSGELGLSAAINVSMAAATVVVLTAGLLAWSLAVTAGDVDVQKRTMGYLGIVLCVLIFLFGIGLLSAWRADSTSDGISYIIDGYRSIVEIDVFVTALVNLAGVVLLTHELKSFLWPYPLFYYGARAKERDDAIREMQGVKTRLEKALTDEQDNLSDRRSQIDKRINEVQKFLETAKSDLGAYVEQLDKVVNIHVKEYVESNREFRTNDRYGYPEPTWFKSALRGDGGGILNVYSEGIKGRIEELRNYMRTELGSTNESDGTWKTEMKSRLREKVEKTKAQIADVQRALSRCSPAMTKTPGPGPALLIATLPTDRSNSRSQPA